MSSTSCLAVTTDAEPALESQAHDFAARLTRVVSSVVADCHPFSARALERNGEERVSVHQEPDTGIPLRVNGEPLLTLKVQYFCMWDTPQHYLAVEKSHFKVYAGHEAKGEPLFRYDYLRSPHPEVPGAHLQIHAHRDGLTHVMSRAGSGSRRGRRRATADAGDVPRVSELHFPLGGARYRPCLEDLMEMLVCELGVDCSPEGRKALADGREDWRRHQLRTAVRDSPSDATAVLERLGYTITPPGDIPADNTDRLREL